jgi:hypothetical protein
MVDGNILNVTRAGTFTIELTAAEDADHTEKVVTASLTVDRLKLATPEPLINEAHARAGTIGGLVNGMNYEIRTHVDGAGNVTLSNPAVIGGSVNFSGNDAITDTNMIGKSIWITAKGDGLVTNDSDRWSSSGTIIIYSAVTDIDGRNFVLNGSGGTYHFTGTATGAARRYEYSTDGGASWQYLLWVNGGANTVANPTARASSSTQTATFSAPVGTQIMVRLAGAQEGANWIFSNTKNVRQPAAWITG